MKRRSIGAAALALVLAPALHAQQVPVQEYVLPNGMKLLMVPMRPTWMPSVQIRVSARSVPDAWRDYVYWTGEIDNDEGGVD